ncbi:hypothetical protein FCIRC_3724 [Fusarium circinatum]|uniref:Uncharacterized protein n=1 Tax=Fusarium circinatum TaxID=48490 RepID=A0A8H5U6J1_FUSCI|nr:hypothetical protein FCIRC_3724 [Fusarium circinatum]
MLQHYLGSKEYIQRAHLEAELPGTLLQDALAVANFPSKNQWLHIKKWGEGHLPNPFLDHDSATIDRLDRLYNRLTIYIEDYITKATSISPSRAYTCIPSPYSDTDQLQFRGNSIGIDILRVETLRDLERHRLFRAFLRYELTSKLRYIEDSMELLFIDRLVAPIFRDLSHGEAEGLRCVHHYMRNLYGAVFAHHANSRFLDIPVETAAETSKSHPDGGLRFPYNMWFSSDAILKDAYAQEPIPYRYQFFGFALMTRLLSVPKDDWRCPMQDMVKVPIRLKQNGLARFLPMFDLFKKTKPYIPLSNRHWDEWSEIGQALRDNGSITFTYGMDFYSFYSFLQKEIYRQRAWAFFDHAGYYPEGNISRHFPTLRQIQDLDNIRNNAFQGLLASWE